MKSHHIVPLFVLVTISGLLIWRAGDDEQFVQSRTTIAALALPATAHGRVIDAAPPSPPAEVQPAPPVVETTWAHPEVMLALRAVYMERHDPSVWRAAIAKALPVLATDQDVQLQVGDLLTSMGDPIDGLAWELLACQHCTQADERIGYGCAAEGLCDPNLELVDVRRRDYGEAMVADALVRMEEIEARIAINDPSALAIFTEIDERRFPKDVGECVQLRTPTPECPPEEILRQTKQAYE